MPKILYHYTSIETLALILKNQSIRFNNLLKVDDMDEGKTLDMGLFGKYINISCWTDDSEESIPLWNMYTPNMHGVRIGLPEYPFKKHYYKKGYSHLEGDIETFINICKLIEVGKGLTTFNQPRLLPVEYTNDISKLFPQVRNCNDIDELQRYLNEEDFQDVDVTYSLGSMGIHKRSNWAFQKEWRYIITCTPMSITEMGKLNTLNEYREIARRLENPNEPIPFDYFDMELDEQQLNNMQILIGPKATAGEKIIVQALVEQFAKGAVVFESTLQIRNKQ